MNEDGHVSISRRGLLAAGLAVAVVGAMGVVSTMNANADDSPDAVAGSTVDLTQTPPPLLVNGQVPRPIVEGRAGASSQALTAAGASAAADVVDPNADTTAFAPKGEVGDTTGVTVAPPPLPPTSRLKAATSTVDFYYAGGGQDAVVEGVGASGTIHAPTFGQRDWHTLGEVALLHLQNPDTDNEIAQTVEVGWTRDRTTFGDNNIHLFVYHWVDSTPSCYGCGFVPLATASIRPGAVLAETTGTDTKTFGILHSGAGWWIQYDTEWIGMFPDSLWADSAATDGFTKSNVVKMFGAVAVPKGSPVCSAMGSGIKPANDADQTAAKFASVKFQNGPAVHLSLLPADKQAPLGVAPQFGQILSKSATTARYGGPVPVPSLCTA
jgi:hypothetical protein